MSVRDERCGLIVKTVAVFGSVEGSEVRRRPFSLCSRRSHFTSHSSAARLGCTLSHFHHSCSARCPLLPAYGCQLRHPLHCSRLCRCRLLLQQAHAASTRSSSVLAVVVSVLTNSLSPLIFSSLRHHHHRHRRHRSVSCLALFASMGSSSSTRRGHRSSADEAVPNMVRSLEQLMAWEERAGRTKHCITGPLVRPKEEGADSTAGSLTRHSQSIGSH